MRILLCGEGPHEFGDPRVWDARTEQHISIEGWMQVLVRTLRGQAVEFEIRRRRELQLVGKGPAQRGLKGHAEKARLARFIADNEEFDAVIFMVDADSNDSRDWASVVADINAGFAALPATITVSAAPCVPMSASESWLLADGNAWAILGLANVGILPKGPETIWGQRDDPTGNHPHRYFSRVCDEAGVPDSRETRFCIMEQSQIATLERQCPVSFPPFALAVTRF